MSEERIVEDQASEEKHNDSINIEEESGVTRRNFLQKTMVVASGLALTSMLPDFVKKWTAAAQTPSCAAPGQPLLPIMEIKSSSSTKTLRAVLKILNENKNYLAASA